MNKITFFISTLIGGGAEGVCVNIANGLAERGWDIDLVVLNLNNAVYLDRVSEKVNIVNLKVDHARYVTLPLRKYLKRSNVKRILVFNYEMAVMLVLIRKLFGLQFKLIARNINNFSQKNKPKGSWWRRFVVVPMINHFYCQADHIINQCKAMEKDLLDNFPQLQGRTSVIYNPVNKMVEDYAKRSDFNNIKKENYLLCVGRLEEQKAFHYAIEAFACISSNFPNLRLKIVGQGSLEGFLRSEAEKHGVSDKVDFEGFQKDIIPYYIHAKATVLTSLYEGFPNVLIESITLGTPVVAFDCPSGPSEIIQEGINGYLVRYKDISDLASALTKMIDNQYNPLLINLTAKSNSTSSILNVYSELLNA